MSLQYVSEPQSTLKCNKKNNKLQAEITDVQAAAPKTGKPNRIHSDATEAQGGDSAPTGILNTEIYLSFKPSHDPLTHPIQSACILYFKAATSNHWKGRYSSKSWVMKTKWRITILYQPVKFLTLSTRSLLFRNLLYNTHQCLLVRRVHFFLSWCRIHFSLQCLV